MSNAPILSPLIAAATEFCSQTVPVIVLQPGRKAPKVEPSAEQRADGTHEQWIITDPEDAETAFKEPANLGILLGPEKNSPVISVGLDLYKDRTVADRVKALNQSQGGNYILQRWQR